MPHTELPPDIYPAAAPAPVASIGGPPLVELAEPLPAPLGPSPAFSLSPLSPSPAPGAWTSPVQLLAPSTPALRSWGVFDMFTLPTWNDLFADANSLGATGLAFLKEQNRTDEVRARLDAERQLAEYRYTALPSYASPSTPALLDWPQLNNLPRWAIYAVVALVLLMLLRK